MLSKQMREAVERWLATHEDEVNQALEDCVKEGAGVALMRAFTTHFQDSMNRMQWDALQKIGQI